MSKYPKGRELWNILKQPIAATLAAVLGAAGAMMVSNAGNVTVDPSSAAFITVLLIDSNSAENFYVMSTFRVLGTLIGIGVGAAIAFVTNALVSNGTSQAGLDSFQLCCLAMALFVPLVIVKQYPKYSSPSFIYLYTVTSLVFAGTSNAVTIATMVAVTGGIFIAAVVMFMFHYKSAEAVLFQYHASLLQSVIDMAKLSVRADASFKPDYLAILDSTKSSFSGNLDSIMNYERWLRWTGRKVPPFNFVALTNALRPMYHQTAALFWSLCRDRVVTTTESSFIFSASSEVYFELYHASVIGIVGCLDSASQKLGAILKLHPKVILAAPKSMLHPWRSAEHEENRVGKILTALLADDLRGYLKHLAELKRVFALHKERSHPLSDQQWMFTEYTFQLSVVLAEMMDYVGIFSEILLPNQPDSVVLLSKQIRALMVYVESLRKEDKKDNTTEFPLPGDDTESITDYKD